MRKTIVTTCLCLGLSANLLAQSESKPLYKDSSKPTEERINDLLSRMTLEEKVMQLNQYTLGRNNNVNNVAKEVLKTPAEIGSVIYFSESADLRNDLQRKAMEESRLGIPVIFAYDVIHGFRTVLPIPLAQACSWNTDLVEDACRVSAQESRMSGVDWTFAPMIDVARDGRWGRIAEGYGEDPYTNARFGVASVKGFQGEGLSNDKSVAACLKHYVGYGASEGGRDYTYTEISNQTLWDTYMLPFEESIKAGAATVMSAFNDISGVPASANHYTLTEVLKNRWKHDGFVVSDWSSIRQLRAQGVASGPKEAAEKAFLAGVEMDMMNNCYNKYLAQLVEEGKISISQIDEAVRRVLRLKFRMGLFEHPYTSTSTANERFLLPTSLKVAEQLAAESMVLLKNENDVLPLSGNEKIAVIGPMAKEKEHLLGSWSAHGHPEDVTSIYEGLESEIKNKAQLFYAQGCGFDGEDKSGFAEAISVAEKADVIVLCLGEEKKWSGENASRSTLALPQIQEELTMELKKTGKPIVLLLSNGRPLELNRIEPLSNAILEIWQPGVAGGKPVASILSGRINPSGKLSVTFPYSTGQIPIYYNYRQKGRPTSGKYQDIPEDPLYELTHGLSYTTFQYGELKASADIIQRGDKLIVEIPVTNTGKRDGAETVHWFISDPTCSISRPVKELKYFEKQFLKAGETKIFRFEVNLEKDLGYVNANGERILENGDYSIMVKDQSLNIELKE